MTHPSADETAERSRWSRYGFATLCVLAGWLAREAIVPLVGAHVLPFIFFFPAVTAAAWFGGLGPGLLAIALSIATTSVTFVPGSGATPTAAMVSLTAFLVASGAIVLVVEAMHRARARASRETESRRGMEREASAARDLLGTTLRSIGDGVIVTDGDGRVRFLNPEAERLTGWSDADAAGRPLVEVFRIVDERTRAPVADPVEKVLRTGALVGLANHTVLVARDGRETPIDDSAAPVRQPGGPTQGVVLVFRDVAEQRASQLALAQLAAIVEHSNDAIFTKDLDGTIRTWNESAARLFGYRPEEIIGRSITMLIPEERLDEEPRILASLRAGRAIERMETVRLAKGGRRIHVAIHVSPLFDADGNVVGASKIVHDITELRAARRALEEEKELLATTLASIGDAVLVTGVDGRVSFLNGEATRLTGWTQAEAEGRSLADVFRIVNEHTREPVEDPVEKVLRHGSVVGLANHTVVIARDGAETAIDDSAAPIRRAGEELQGVVLVFRDITERKRAEASLRESEERFRLMADSAPVLIWLRDLGGRCTWLNEQWLAFVGRTMDGSIGDGWTDDVHPEDLTRCLETYEAALAARVPFSVEYRLRRHDGEYRWMLDRGTPRTVDGHFAGFIGSCVDITDRRLAEELLVQADRRKDEFLATLSHELRNPITPIGLAVAMLRRSGAAQREAKTFVDVLERQTQQLTRLLDDLLDVSRITSGKIVLRRDRVALGAAVTAAVETSRPLIDAAGHELVLRIPPVPIDVEADFERLAQVFANLLNNAAKYTERGGRITLSVERDGGEAVVRVRDTGVGLSAEQLPRIFEMFAQVDRTLERRQGGLGVGLSLAQKLVELHGGTIEAHSAGIGKGSEFVVRLPVVGEQRPVPVAPSGNGNVSGARVHRTRRVLIADDNVDSADLLALALRDAGHEVRTVNDGRSAVEEARSFDPEVVLLDIGMPEMNGYDVARNLRREFGERLRLVAVTGWGQPSDRRQTSEAGFDLHLTKPVDLRAILEFLG